MGKNKRARLLGRPTKSSPLKLRNHSSARASSPSSNAQALSQRANPTSNSIPHSRTTKKPHIQTQHTTPIIPFLPEDRILLVGEGDLSFVKSLVEAHGCLDVTATVLEGSEVELREKYGDERVAGALMVILGEELQIGQRGERDAEEEEGHKDGGGCDEEDMAEKEGSPGTISGKSRRRGRVLYGVDATKMTWPGKRKSERWDRIIFNFPHVGGKSTDVNRQVRYNQELLVKFFQSSEPLLSPHGSIIVTLFEGPPYTLWNIKDLARHSGLAVERSFAFQAAAYPGYAHARTLGVIKSKKSGESGGGWKGEERKARSFVFVRKGEVTGLVQEGKRKRRDSTDEDERNI